MSEELKPCPFCGRPVELRYERRYVGPDTYQVWCGFVSCGINPSTGEHLDEAEAIAAWNRRAPMTAPTPAGEEMGELPNFAQIYTELEIARENLNRRHSNNNDASAGRSARAIFSAMCLLDTARALLSTSASERGLREALEEAERALSIASRILTDDHKVALNGKAWGESALADIRAALSPTGADGT